MGHEARVRAAHNKKLADRLALVVDLLGVLIARQPGGDAVVVTDEDRKALLGKRVVLNPVAGGVSLQLATLEVVQGEKS